MFGILLVTSQPSKQPMPLGIGRTSLTAVAIMAVANYEHAQF